MAKPARFTQPESKEAIEGTNLVEGIYEALGAAQAGLINNNDNLPKAYLNHLFFDKNMQFKNGGFAQVTEQGNGEFEELLLNFIPDEEGFIMVYTSNQTNEDLDVFFDDMTVLHTSGPIIRVDDYGQSHASRHYPFGLTYNTSQLTGALTNRFLFNSNEFIDELSMNFFDFNARAYEPALGRFLRIDPMAESSRAQSPFQFANNNPEIFNDPLGLKADYGVASWAMERQNWLEASGWATSFSSHTAGRGAAGGGPYMRHLYMENLKDLKRKAEAGDPNAVYELGGTYITDRSTIKAIIGVKSIYDVMNVINFIAKENGGKLPIKDVKTYQQKLDAVKNLFNEYLNNLEVIPDWLVDINEIFTGETKDGIILGQTQALYSDNINYIGLLFLIVYINPRAFETDLLLFNVVGHEVIHCIIYSNGIYGIFARNYNIDYAINFSDAMAYTWNALAGGNAPEKSNEYYLRALHHFNQLK